VETYVNTNSREQPVLSLPSVWRVLAGTVKIRYALHANGNAIHFTPGCYDTACNQLYTAITDDAGMRFESIATLAMPLRWILGDSFDTITAQGRRAMTTTVNFEIIQLGYNNDRTYAFSNAPWLLTKQFYRVPGVKYIQFAHGSGCFIRPDTRCLE